MISEYPEIEVVAEVDGKWIQSGVQDNFPKVLEQHSDIDLIFAHNDIMALTAYEICKQKEIEQQIAFFGVDGLSGPNGGIQFVNEGILEATFIYPTGGQEAILTAKAILNGEDFKKENFLETTTINERNVHVMNMQIQKILKQQKDIERQQEKIDQQTKFYKNQQLVSYILLFTLILALILAALGQTHQSNVRKK